MHPAISCSFITALRILILCFFFFVTKFACFGQDEVSYTFQKDDTVLKRKYYDQSVSEKEKLLALPGKENKREFKEIYDKRLEQVSDLLLTSRSVTSREEHNYLQLIAGKIIQANKELKQLNPRVVFSRDWWPNAYSMGEGTIVINAGLLIFLDNEAELAFILSHELSHYFLDHSGQSIKKYVETVNSNAFQKELKKLSKEKYRVNEKLEKLSTAIVFNSRRHSRAHETGADSLAFILLKNSGYDLKAAKTALQKLDEIDEMVLFQPLNLENIFTFPDYPFKQKWIDKETSIFSQLTEAGSIDSTETDSLKTHPDCVKRIAFFEKYYTDNKQNGIVFLVNEKRFRQLKTGFFFEMTEQSFITDNLSRNLYYSLLLLDEKPLNRYAVFSIVRCLNRIYEKQKNHSIGNSIDKESASFPMEYNLLLRMLDRLRLDEVIAICTGVSKKYNAAMIGYPGYSTEENKIKHFNK